MTSFLLGYVLALLWHRDKKMETCPRCKQWIRANKPFFGSLHLCEETRWPS